MSTFDSNIHISLFPYNDIVYILSKIIKTQFRKYLLPNVNIQELCFFLKYQNVYNYKLYQFMEIYLPVKTKYIE